MKLCDDTNRIDIMKQVSFINMVIKKKEKERERIRNPRQST